MKFDIRVLVVSYIYISSIHTDSIEYDANVPIAFYKFTFQIFNQNTKGSSIWF